MQILADQVEVASGDAPAAPGAGALCVISERRGPSNGLHLQLCATDTAAAMFVGFLVVDATGAHRGSNFVAASQPGPAAGPGGAGPPAAALATAAAPASGTGIQCHPLALHIDWTNWL